MSNLMFVANNNITVISPFKFKCNHCGTEFDIGDVTRKCPNADCNVELFERMTKSSFKELLIECLVVMGVNEINARTTINVGHMPLNTLGICNELTTIIDRNFEVRFGGQYKSFLVKETYDYIKEYNFRKD